MSEFTDHFSSDEGVQDLIKKMAGDIKLQRFVLNHQPSYAWVEKDGSINRHTAAEIERVWIAHRAVDVKAVIALDDADNLAAAEANQRQLEKWPNPQGSTGGDWFSDQG